MSNPLLDWVKPGHKMYMSRKWVDGYDGPFEINKVHKTGRFTLHGKDVQQFSPRGDCAFPSGRDSWDGRVLFPDSPEFQERLSREKQRVENVAKIGRMQRLLESVQQRTPDNLVNEFALNVDRFYAHLMLSNAANLLRKEDQYAVEEAGA